MATNSDIVLDVTRAADAAKQRAAVSRLELLSGKPVGEAGSAAPAVEPDQEWSTAVRIAADTSRPAVVRTSAKAHETTDKTSDKKSDVYVQFEALLVQNMIESMLPKDAEAVFGSGTAGEVWKSMLAEKIAAEIARTGTLGIAKQIAAGPMVSSAPPRAEGAAPQTKAKADSV
jgi:Rod binding domain-containing protein